MLLKKQTVWLLTMLSLVVVLSVYYITSPEQQKSDLAGVEEKKAEDKETAATETKDGKTVVSGVASDEKFEALRMKLEEQRTKQKEELQTVAATTDLPAEERSEAIDKMNQLDAISQKEQILETLITSMGYEDALVRADGENVRITVKAKEHSASAANEIIQMVRTELGSFQPVAVQFDPAK
ncbi:SpoIIIAH-like family protein [Bacillus sp. ISL-35]|jgi:stage III sporulation protein AH|uniref:SpoIIIAH-like family protein n=1 Tax=Bacillus sp. ISL-35 TaxID=2819122 RepID=UPI001BEBEC2E|nr:SpoIIIAH-like family protein [Bacillus sp. ISL-35]MBT2677557.1 SpoIIIAH-like family protein [Bacillus sp. ISL-35]MBT2702055.1 SpoIIIAH-like family protein [Chryseobacterium sp. ISL-80]